uniref:G-protein coupled receptors family 1 profile domain-containing protein n=1 Tax=Chelonoidis abingdonii TaxID=106734 RepID=A0A8C0IQH4_CHEAB
MFSGNTIQTHGLYSDWAWGSGNLSLEGPLLGWAAGGLGHTGHSMVALCLGIILVLGCLNNLLVLLIFLKFASIRTPINLILLNISLSDLPVCVFGTPFSDAGCKWYGFANALFSRCGQDFQTGVSTFGLLNP